MTQLLLTHVLILIFFSHAQAWGNLFIRITPKLSSRKIQLLLQLFATQNLWNFAVYSHCDLAKLLSRLTTCKMFSQNSYIPACKLSVVIIFFFVKCLHCCAIPGVRNLKTQQTWFSDETRHERSELAALCTNKGIGSFSPVNRCPLRAAGSHPCVSRICHVPCSVYWHAVDSFCINPQAVINRIMARAVGIHSFRKRLLLHNYTPPPMRRSAD